MQSPLTDSGRVSVASRPRDPVRKLPSRRWCLILTLILGCLAFWPTSVTAALMPRLSLAELTGRSDLIFTGKVLRIENDTSRENAIPFTVVTFEIAELLHAGPAARQRGRDSIRLRFPGGTRGGFDVILPDTPTFRLGETFLVFARDDGQDYVSPTIGGHQGLFRVSREQNVIRTYDNAEFALESDDGGRDSGARDSGARDSGARDSGARHVRPSVVAARSTGASGPERAALPLAMAGTVRPPGGQSVTSGVIVKYAEFAATIKALLASPPVDVALPDATGGGFYWLDPDGAIRRRELTGKRPSPYDRAADRSTRPTPHPEGNRTLVDPLCVDGYHSLHIQMEQVASGWDYDVYRDAMVDWNRYMDVFRNTTNDGSFGGNGENEFAGFVNDADLNSAYGFNWGGALAVTAIWVYTATNEIAETDVAINSAFDWTRNLDIARASSSKYMLGSVVMHEIGHIWGYQIGDCVESYRYQYISVMHAYYGNIIEDGRGIHGVDAYFFRDNYDDQTSVISIADMGVESYVATSGGTLARASTNQSAYNPGENITFQGITVENTGTSSRSEVRVRFYLSEDTNITTSDHQVGGYIYWSSFCDACYSEPNYTTTVPTSIPSGDYYVGAIVTVNGFGSDGYAQNDRVSFTDRVTIDCQSVTASPTNGAGSDDRCDGINITWNWSGSGQDGFKVKRDGSLVHTGSDPGERAWLDSAASDGNHSYQIYAYNNCGDGPTRSASGTRLDGLTASPTNGAGSDDRCDGINVTWNWSGSGQDGFKVKRDGSLVHTGSDSGERAWLDSAASDGNHSYQIYAYNDCGDGPTRSASGTRLDGVTATPTNGAGSDDRCDGINVTWNWSGSGHDGFKVKRDGSLVHTGSNPGGRAWLDSAASDGNHSYQIYAYNGCEDGPTRSASGTRLGDLTTSPTNGAGSDDRCDGVNVTWNWSGSGHDGFKVKRDGSLVHTGSDSGERAWLDSAASDGNHSYQIYAYNNCGDGPTRSASGTRLDGLTASPTNGAGSDDRCDGVNVTWNWSGSGQDGFKVKRDGSLVHTGNDPAERAWFDSAASDGNHSYQIYAYNNCGDGPTRSASGTRLDGVTTSPTNGAGSDDRCDGINVTWNWSGSGQDGFKVKRDGSLVHTGSDPGERAWLDSAASDGNHSYQIYAYNSCGDGPTRSASGTRLDGPLLLRHVPTDYPTIQAAIDVACTGDTILIADGTHTGSGNRDLDFLGKAITVRSQSGDPATCILDCQGSGRGFYFHSAEGSGSVLSGLTIRGGHTGDAGGAILCSGASPTIIDCILTGNRADGDGGGLSLDNGSVPTLIGCIISENVATSGGGLHVAGQSSVSLTHCTFYRNAADTRGGGIECSGESSVTLQNCIIAASEQGESIACDNPASNAVLTCCDVYGNAGGDWVGPISDQAGVNGNLAVDPLFCVGEEHALVLAENSPCAVANNPGCGLIGAAAVGCAPIIGVAESPRAPTAFKLHPNAPNPFNPSTRLHYDLPVRARVRLTLYDITGRRIRVLVDEARQEFGQHAVHWDGRDSRGRAVPSGVYYYVLEADTHRETQRLVLLR